MTYQDLLAVDQNLLVAKARVAPKGMSIPRWELVAEHMLAKLQNGVSKALTSFPITGYHNWVDSVTVLYWLTNRGEWSTFVRNRVKKIVELTDSSWKYVPTSENPSDLGTRGAAPDKLTQLWFKGPSWIYDETDNPEQPAIMETDEVKLERGKKEALMLTEDKAQETLKRLSEGLLNKFPYWKLLRITAYVRRFTDGCRNRRRNGPLTRFEIMEAERTWVQIVQQTCDMTTNLKLTTDDNGVMRCNERIQDYKPIFIPRKSALARRIIEHCHLQTLHGGVAATMNRVRQKYWIPRLDRKSVV